MHSQLNKARVSRVIFQKETKNDMKTLDRARLPLLRGPNPTRLYISAGLK